MSDNFRQKIEKILACNDWRHCGVRGKTCYECRIDRILALITEEQAPMVGLEEPLTNVWHESNLILEEIDRRRWITDGRGPYKYDDDTYRKETGLAFDAIEDRVKELQKSLKSIDAAMKGEGK